MNDRRILDLEKFCTYYDCSGDIWELIVLNGQICLIIRLTLLFLIYVYKRISAQVLTDHSNYSQH